MDRLTLAMEFNFKNSFEQLRQELGLHFRRGERIIMDHHSGHGSIEGHRQRTHSPKPAPRRTPPRGKSPLRGSHKGPRSMMISLSLRMMTWILGVIGSSEG